MEITKQELNKFIKEMLDKEVERIISEYADPRNKFIDRVDSLMPQLVENWCLVHYCTLTNTDINQCKNHWKQELKNVLFSVALLNLKGNNSPKKRFETIEYAEDLRELMTNHENIFFQISVKFENEGINTDDNNDIIDKCIEDLIQNKSIIINAVVSKDRKKITDYINSI